MGYLTALDLIEINSREEYKAEFFPKVSKLRSKNSEIALDEMNDELATVSINPKTKS
ncbi:MAG: hypothetical protein ACJA08_000385 [Cyclobacteriaceae bacterium]